MEWMSLICEEFIYNWCMYIIWFSVLKVVMDMVIVWIDVGGFDVGFFIFILLFVFL